MDVSDKNQALHNSIDERTKSNSLFKKREVSNKFLLIMMVNLLAMFLIGAFAASTANYMKTVDGAEGPNVYHIENYTITLLDEDHPELDGGTVAFTYPNQKGDIFIQKTLDVDEIVVSCNHELLHDMGIGTEYHNFIYKNQDDVSSSVCTKLGEKVRNDRS